MNESVYLGRNVTHSAYLSIEVNRRIRDAWSSFWKYTLELLDRPSTPLELKLRMLSAEVLEIMLYGCITWSPRACHHDTLYRAYHSFLIRCIGWRKNIRADHPISGHAYESEKIEHRGDFAQEADLVRGICGTYGGYETAEVPDVHRIDGGCALRGSEGKRVDGVFPGQPQSFRHQRRPVNDCS